MSHKALNWAFAADMDDATAKSVLVVLANHADKDSWRAYPAVETIMRHTALRDRAIQGALKRLIGWGAVSASYRPGDSTVYILNKDWTGYLTPAPKTGVKRAPNPAPDAPPQEMHPRISRQGPPHMTTNTPAPDAGKPLREPILTSCVVGARAILAIESVWPDLKSDMAFVGLTGSLGMVSGWVAEGADLERDIMPAITACCQRLKAKGHGPPRTMGYFRQPIADAKASNEQGLPNASAPRTATGQQPKFRNGFAAVAHARLGDAAHDGRREHPTGMDLDEADHADPASGGRRLAGRA